MKQQMVSRFRYLWTWELFNALVVFPVSIFAIGLNIHIGLATLLATASLSALLLIGSAFSFIKYRDLKNGTRHIHDYEPAFKLLRGTIPLWLLGVAVMIYLQSSIAETEEMLLSIFLFVLVVLEYINYFQYQLMYDNRHDLHYLMTHRRLKRGIIPREFGW